MSTLKIKRENGKIFCPLADSWHIETPEEKVRQEYIKILVENYGYSLDQMAQEIKVNNSQRGQGKARADIVKYNISKKEWILNGETVIYADFNSIKDTLDYDFATEKQFSYEGLSVEASVKHLAKFASDIWQIHPFGEGNTRATAVFMIKYMKTFGFRVNNDAFRENSWYFRNALVRANYNDLQKGIHSTTKFLELFFSNLLLGTNYELKNRYMHVDFVDENTSQSAKSETPKCQIDTLKCTLEELAVLDLIKKNPSVKQTELAEQTGKSVRSIKRITDSLKEKQYLRRVDGKRYGKWEVLA